MNHPDYMESVISKCRELFVGLYNYTNVCIHQKAHCHTYTTWSVRILLYEWRSCYFVGVVRWSSISHSRRDVLQVIGIRQLRTEQIGRLLAVSQVECLVCSLHTQRLHITLTLPCPYSLQNARSPMCSPSENGWHR